MRTRWDLLPRRVKRPGMLAGGDGSTLSLDFTAMSGLDSRFTFSRSSTATYINSSGLVTTMAAASTNDPTKARFDHDPTTLAPRGLLIEGSATNLCLQSAAMRTSPWSTANLTTAGASITAPDGTDNGVELVWTNTTAVGLGYTFQEVAVAASTAYTMSVYLKPKGVNINTALYIQARAGTTSLGYMTVSFLHTSGSMGTVANGPFTSTSATSTNVGNGWYRVTVTGTSPATTTNIRFFIVNANIGDGTDGVYAWGAQLEAGSGASSYIPTGASTVQRASESCSIAASSSWLNTASGTFVANWHRGDRGGTERSVLSSDYVAGRLLQLNNTDVSISVSLLWYSGNIFRTTGTAINKAAYTYGQTTGSGATLQLPVRLCVNGSAVATGTFGNGTTNGADVPNPVNWTNFVIGAASSSNPYTTANRDFLNNCVRSIKYWPTILPDATLQGLTS